MAEQPKPLPPVQISAADLLSAMREQPVALAESQRKIEREQAQARAAEFDSWKHLRRLKGVASVDSFLFQEDTGGEDKNNKPIIKTILRAVAVLDSGKEITAEAYTDAKLKELLTGRVHEALGTKQVEKRAWTPLAKEFAPV